MSPADPEERYKYFTAALKAGGVTGGNMRLNQSDKMKTVKNKTLILTWICSSG